MKVGVIAAMKEEMTAFSKFSYKENREITGPGPIRALTCGIGKVNAALGAQKLIDDGCEHIHMIGVCASLSPEIPVFETVNIIQAIQYDYGYSMPNLPEAFKLVRPGRIPEEEFDSPYYHADQDALRSIRNYLSSNAVMATGDQFVARWSVAQDVIDMTQATVLDMETAAVAQVCNAAGIGWTCVKTVSDLCRDEDPEAFSRNLKKALAKNGGFNRHIIADLAGVM